MSISTWMSQKPHKQKVLSFPWQDPFILCQRTNKNTSETRHFHCIAKTKHLFPPPVCLTPVDAQLIELAQTESMGKKPGSIRQFMDASVLRLLWENCSRARQHCERCIVRQLHVCTGFSVVHKGTIMTKNYLFLLFYGLLLGSLLKSHPWEPTMCG